MARTNKKPLDCEPPRYDEWKCDTCSNTFRDVVSLACDLYPCPRPRCKGLLRLPGWIGWHNRTHEKEKEVRSEWCTPLELFEPIDDIFRFTLDVAASRENALCDCYHDKAADGLLKDWYRERCWMNPPYDNVAEWVDKASRAAKSGATVVAPLSGDTSTGWYHAWALSASEIYLLVPRVRFVPPEGIPESSNSSCTHLVVWRPQLVKALPRFIPWPWRLTA